MKRYIYISRAKGARKFLDYFLVILAILGEKWEIYISADIYFKNIYEYGYLQTELYLTGNIAISLYKMLYI